MQRLSTEVMERYDRVQASQGDPCEKLYFEASRDKFRLLLELMEAGPHGSILELGTSRFSLLLKGTRPELEVVTLDLGPDGGECARAGVTQVVADLLEPPIPLPEATFDVVLFSEVLEHLQGNPRVAFREILRVLKPGGRMLLTTPNLARLTNRLKLLLGRSPLERVGPPGWGGHIREYCLEEVVDFVRTAGFEVTMQEHALYWDGLELYLSAGPRGYDEQGRFFYHPRYVGIRRRLVLPVLMAVRQLVLRVPSLRYGMVVVGRRPV